jgi:plastocyanin
MAAARIWTPVRFLAVTTLATSALGACGGGSEEVTLVDGVVEEVGVIDNTFRPGRVEVAAGTEVVWSNKGRNDHNVLPVEGDGWGVEAADFAPGDTYRYRFTEPGTYDYYCSLHGTTTKGMVGTIVVTG